MHTRVGLTGVLLTASLGACSSVVDSHREPVRGSGVLVTQVRDIGRVDAASLSGVGRVIVDVGLRESLTITAEDNILPFLTSDVVGGRLILGTLPGTSVSPRREIVYHLTVRHLRDLDVSGAGVINADGVDTDFFSARISGAGHIVVAGSADEQDVVISGAGSYDAGDLESLAASVVVSGAGVAVVRVRDFLDARVSGTGVIEYVGTPEVIQQVSGAGAVRRVGRGR